MSNLKTHWCTHTLGSIHALRYVRNKSLISRICLRKHRYMPLIIGNCSQRNEISSVSAIPSLLVQMV
jgi:hypothetical protein